MEQADKNHFPTVEDLLDIMVLQHGRVPLGQDGFDGVVDFYLAGLPAEVQRDQDYYSDHAAGVVQDDSVELHLYLLELCPGRPTRHILFGVLSQDSGRWNEAS